MPNLSPNWHAAKPVDKLAGKELSASVAYVFDRWSGALQAVVYAGDDGHIITHSGRSAFLNKGNESDNRNILQDIKHKLKRIKDGTREVLGDIIIWYTCSKSEAWRYSDELKTSHPDTEKHDGTRIQYIQDDYMSTKALYREELGVGVTEEEIPAPAAEEEAPIVTPTNTNTKPTSQRTGGATGRT